jgi:hypothetical protein
MSDCTERQSAAAHDGLAGEGQEGMTKAGEFMTGAPSANERGEP